MCVCQTLPRVSKSQTVCRIPKDKVFFLLPIDSSSSFSRDLAQIYDAWRDLDKIAGKEGRTGGPDELVKKRGKPAGKTRLCVTSNIINSMQGIRRISPLRRHKYSTNYSRPPKKKGRKFLNWSQQSRQSRTSTSALCLAMARTGRRLPYLERPGCEWAAFHNTMKSIDFAVILASKGQDIEESVWLTGMIESYKSPRKLLISNVMAAVYILLLPLLSILLFRLIFLLLFRLVIMLLLFRLISTNLLDPLVLAIRASQKTIKPRVVSTALCFFHPQRVASVLRRVSTWRSSKGATSSLPFHFHEPTHPRQTSFLSSLLCAFSSSTASASNLFSTALGPRSDVFGNWNQSAIWDITTWTGGQIFVL